MTNKKAIITGFTGQDGSYLADLLLRKGYDVFGLVRRNSHENLNFIKEMGLEKVKLVHGDLADSVSLIRMIKDVQPDELYNLAAQSHVGESFAAPEVTADITGLGVLRLLEAIRVEKPSCKFYQASSSEMFGDVLSNKAQDETTELRPRSPYGAAKVFGHHLVKVYRESYGIFACSGQLFNHESYRRGEQFVTRKITKWIGENILNPEATPLELGYIYSERDWGFAGDYVDAMWRMLQQNSPDDYVIATGETHSVKDFCNLAFKVAGFDLYWRGEGIDETAHLSDDRMVIRINPEFYRPAEVPRLLGDHRKAKRILGWEPKTSFSELVTSMVNYDLRTLNVYSAT